MNFLQFKIFRIIALVTIVGLFLTQTNIAGSLFTPKVASAFTVGDLIIDWGVPEGDPIFVVENMAPGDTEVREVEITNSGTTVRPIAIRGIPTSPDESLAGAMTITIMDGATILFSGDLDDFFVDSEDPDGIELFNLNGGQTKTLTFTALFKPDADNTYQDKTLVFDLVIGLAIDVPLACIDMDLDFADPIYGTGKSDKIQGTSGNDLIFALEGSDKVDGKGGDDCIVGGSGSDSLEGSNGHDVLIGGPGSDSLRGNNGNDKLFGEEGSDSLDGGNGNDELYGGSGSDSIDGGNGRDKIFGEGDSDSMDGGSDNDEIDGGAGIDSAKGGPGTDKCIAESKKQCEL